MPTTLNIKNLAQMKRYRSELTEMKKDGSKLKVLLEIVLGVIWHCVDSSEELDDFHH